MFRKILLLLIIVISHVHLMAKGIDAHVDGVLGTSFDISLHGVDSKQAELAVNNLLDHINQLEGKLSTWQKNSEISQLNIKKTTAHLSVDLFNVLTLCQQWENVSKHHFSCRIGTLSNLWVNAVNKQKTPDRIQLRRIARDIIKQPFIDLTNKSLVTIASPIQLDISGVAKGYILDNSVEYLTTHFPKLTGIKINIGGDIITWGNKSNKKPWLIAIASHNNNDDNQQTNVINVSQGAIAHSGVGERDFIINRRHFNHILDPKEGWPLSTSHNATVYAPTATQADAIATALNTMEIAEGIDWVNRLDHVEALIQTENNSKYSSQGWYQLIVTNNNSQPIPQLEIDYQIPKFKSTDYEKPYLSIWLTNTNNKFIRQILLLGEANRWAQENKRWWRTVGRKHDDLLDALARPTRKPGHYSANWNGYDAHNTLVIEKNVILHMEAAREKGGHFYQKKLLNLTQKGSITLSENGELGKTQIIVN